MATINTTGVNNRIIRLINNETNEYVYEQLDNILTTIGVSKSGRSSFKLNEKCTIDVVDKATGDIKQVRIKELAEAFELTLDFPTPPMTLPAGVARVPGAVYYDTMGMRAFLTFDSGATLTEVLPDDIETLDWAQVENGIGYYFHHVNDGKDYAVTQSKTGRSWTTTMMADNDAPYYFLGNDGSFYWVVGSILKTQEVQASSSMDLVIIPADYTSPEVLGISKDYIWISHYTNAQSIPQLSAITLEGTILDTVDLPDGIDTMSTLEGSNEAAFITSEFAYTLTYNDGIQIVQLPDPLTMAGIARIKVCTMGRSRSLGYLVSYVNFRGTEDNQIEVYYYEGTSGPEYLSTVVSNMNTYELLRNGGVIYLDVNEGVHYATYDLGVTKYPVLTVGETEDEVKVGKK